MIITKPFQFLGKGPCSKSLLNRSWIVKSYYPDFNIIGSSDAEDIRVIKKAVQDFFEMKEIYCGKSASAFRFMALRVSRSKGRYILTGDDSLFLRPHQELIKIFNQLGVHAEFKSKNRFFIDSKGWDVQGDALTFSSECSSQFASAIFLNSFELERDLFISLEGRSVSFSYLKMTLSFLKNLGMKIEGSSNEFRILKNQKITRKEYEAEPDMSCLFSLACFAVLKGQAVFTPWIENSLQPDFLFPDILKKMGVVVSEENNSLKIKSGVTLSGIALNIKNNPDMFPSLAVLCSLSEGESLLYGASHLQYKESNRLEQIFGLMEKINRKFEKKKDGVWIKGSREKGKGKKIIIDPCLDHRIAMAGCLLSYYDFDVEIKDTGCINKSFPQFCSIIGYMSE